MIRTRNARIGWVGKRSVFAFNGGYQRTVMILALTTVIAVAEVLNGCGAVRPSRYYQLSVPGQGSAQAAAPMPVRLLVAPLFASHIYREDRIIYSSAGQRMGMYEYERWAEPPTEMVQEVLLRQLRASGRYHAVYAQRSTMNGDFLIRGRLYDFKEVSEEKMLARVTFELEMRDLKSGGTVWTHYYSHDEPVSGKDVPSIVAAIDRSVQSGVTEVLASLDQYFQSHPVK